MASPVYNNIPWSEEILEKVILRLASSVYRRSCQGSSSTATLLWVVSPTQRHLLWPVLCGTVNLPCPKYLGKIWIASCSFLHSHGISLPLIFHQANTKPFACNCRVGVMYVPLNINQQANSLSEMFDFENHVGTGTPSAVIPWAWQDFFVNLAAFTTFNFISQISH